jgi:hypothetical protein
MQEIDGAEIRKVTSEVCNDTIMVEGFVDLTNEQETKKKKKKDKEMKELKDIKRRK